MANSPLTNVRSSCCGQLLVERSWPSMFLGRQVYFCGCGRNYSDMTARGQKGK